MIALTGALLTEILEMLEFDHLISSEYILINTFNYLITKKYFKTYLRTIFYSGIVCTPLKGNT